MANKSNLEPEFSDDDDYLKEYAEAHHYHFNDAFGDEQPQNADPPRGVVARPSAEEVKQMMEEQQESDHKFQFRRRESFESFVVQEEDKPYHMVDDHSRNVTIGFWGFTPIKHEGESRIVVDDKYSLDDDMNKKLCIRQPKKMFGSKFARVGRPKEVAICKLKMECHSDALRLMSPCKCPDCHVETGDEQRKANEGKDVPKTKGRGRPRKRMGVSKEAIEAPPSKKDMPDGTEMPICKKGRLMCNCGYCRWRKACDLTAHPDNTYHRTKCTSCLHNFTLSNGVKAIVAVFQIRCELLFDLDKKEDSVVADQLISMLGSAITGRFVDISAKIGYIEQENCYTYGHYDQHFIVSICCQNLAAKLRALIDRVDSELDFQIAEAPDTKYENMMLMWQFDSVQKFVEATTEAYQSMEVSREGGDSNPKLVEEESDGENGTEEKDESSTSPEKSENADEGNYTPSDEDFDEEEEEVENTDPSDDPTEESSNSNNSDEESDLDDEDEEIDEEEEEGGNGKRVVAKPFKRAHQETADKDVHRSSGKRVVAKPRKRAHQLSSDESSAPSPKKVVKRMSNKGKTLKRLRDSDELSSLDDEDNKENLHPSAPPRRRPPLFEVRSVIQNKKMRLNVDANIQHEPKPSSSSMKHSSGKSLFEPRCKDFGGNHNTNIPVKKERCVYKTGETSATSKVREDEEYDSDIQIISG